LYSIIGYQIKIIKDYGFILEFRVFFYEIFYTKPVDAISYSVLGLVAIFLVNKWDIWSEFDRVVYLTSMFFLTLVLIFSFLGILLKDSSKPIRLNISKSSLVVSDFFGYQREKPVLLRLNDSKQSINIFRKPISKIE
jgi:hypothetical protein